MYRNVDIVDVYNYLWEIDDQCRGMVPPLIKDYGAASAAYTLAHASMDYVLNIVLASFDAESALRATRSYKAHQDGDLDSAKRLSEDIRLIQTIRNRAMNTILSLTPMVTDVIAEALEGSPTYNGLSEGSKKLLTDYFASRDNRIAIEADPDLRKD
jgi:hypothetical protein